MPDDRLIVALDPPRVPNVVSGQAAAESLGDAVSFYKIGLGMLTTGGFALALDLKEKGKRVFLDLKLFDIPATIEAAVRGVASFDLDFLTVQGDPHVVRAAMEGKGQAQTHILAVSVLTSLDRGDLDDAMIRDGALADVTVERARRALAAGADGVITSPHEAALIRALHEAEGRLIVTPGVRPDGADLGDQKRVATPAEALSNGADHIVVGRPVMGAPNPKSAVEAIVASLP
ncbi:MAG: orotidine-5'-phosphate decarboxylase [Pseudomonadota bacterium]